MGVLDRYGTDFLIVFGVAFGLALLLTPLTIALGKRYGIVARPGGRRLHSGDISQLGGLAMVVAFTGAVIVAQFTRVETTDPNEGIRLTGLLVGGIFIYLVGLFDDKYELSPLPLYIAQLIAGAIAISFLIFIESFNNPLTGSTEGGWHFAITVTISLFWFGLMMNTVNWLDGLDGLAAGVVCISAIMIFLHSAFELNQVSVGLLALALCGATLGFLPFNFSPAKVFMGSGAVYLGYTIGALSIIGGAKMATILLVMGLPLLDAAWQIMRRALQGQNPVIGDRGHLHFRLLDIGYSTRTIVLGYYTFCAGFGGIALMTASRLFKLLSLLVMGGVLLGVFIFIGWQSRKNEAQRSAAEKPSA